MRRILKNSQCLVHIAVLLLGFNLKLKGKNTVLSRLQLGLLMGLVFVASANAQLPNDFNGFETGDGFSVGVFTPSGSQPAAIDSGNSWFIESGSAEIPITTVADGAQALTINANASVDSPLSGGNAQDVWLQAYYRTTPQDSNPDVTGLGESSALMYFNSGDGIRVYNGATPAWEAIGVSVDPNLWYKITVDLKFPADTAPAEERGTWDIYVQEQGSPVPTAPARSGIGFKDASVRSYSGFRVRSGDSGPGYLDNFYVGDLAPPEFRQTIPMDGMNFLVYSTIWSSTRTNETDFENESAFLYNLDGNDEINWLDIFQYMKEFRNR